MNETGKRRLRTGLLVAIGALYLASVPWYRDGDDPVRLVFGLPDWVAVALACYATAAVLNAAAWLLTEVPDAEPPEKRSRDAQGQRNAARDPR